MRPSRYFIILTTVWMVAMTWRIYPQFKDTLRIEGHLVTVGAYVEDACGQRVGPAAVTCLAEARETGQRLLRREQGKSVLLILAPLLGYLLIYLPFRFAINLLGRRRGVPAVRDRA